MGPESTTIEAGLPVILDCIIDGFPLPIISWFKDGLPLRDCSLEPVGQVCITDVFTVYLPSARPEDSGAYTCLAEGTDTTITLTAVVTVLPRRSECMLRLWCAPNIIMSPFSPALHQLATCYSVCVQWCICETRLCG